MIWESGFSVVTLSWDLTPWYFVLCFVTFVLYSSTNNPIIDSFFIDFMAVKLDAKHVP